MKRWVGLGVIAHNLINIHGKQVRPIGLRPRSCGLQTPSAIPTGFALCRAVGQSS